MGLPARSDELVAEPSPPLRLIAPVSPTRRELATRRARRVVCWTLVSIVLVNVGMGAFFFRHPGRTDPDYWTRLERVRARTGPAAGSPFTVFVLGSSRTQLGLLASQLEKSLTETLQRPVVAISFSSPGAGPLQELFTWWRLQRDGYRPDLLIVEIHPALLNVNRAVGHGMGEASWPVSRFSWSDLDFVEEHASETRPGIRQEWLYSSISPLHHFRINFLSETTPLLLPLEYRLATKDLDASGQICLEDQPRPPEVQARGVANARKDYFTGLQTFEPGPSVGKMLDLLDSSRAAGVPTVTLVTPEGPSFRSWYGPGVWPKIEKCLNGIAADSKTPLLNTQTWLREDEFLDSHHLTHAAAFRYTDRLAREELTPLLQKWRSQQRLAARHD
jgi:hypothetical protein